MVNQIILGGGFKVLNPFPPRVYNVIFILEKSLIYIKRREKHFQIFSGKQLSPLPPPQLTPMDMVDIRFVRGTAGMEVNVFFLDLKIISAANVIGRKYYSRVVLRLIAVFTANRS